MAAVLQNNGHTVTKKAALLQDGRSVRPLHSHIDSNLLPLAVSSHPATCTLQSNPSPLRPLVYQPQLDHTAATMHAHLRLPVIPEIYQQVHRGFDELSGAG
ncbi:hypothetical protein BaRGS_00004752 [Batillaria attramentaria]|uniref:Uncharacterized protein n=1 Tax=Batillaria attramentaria TaxID=370345 RepID=A0ABD0LWK9_9CAEN